MSNLILTCTIQTQKFTRQITFNFQEPEISKEVLQKKKRLKSTYGIIWHFNY